MFNYVYGKENDKYIYIDAGHGGFDGGAYVDYIKEKDITLNVSKMLSNYLCNIGYKCILTRYDDNALSDNKKEDIYKRVDLINRSNAILYISIHANMYTDSKYYGAQTFFNKNNKESEILSNMIQNNFKRCTNTTRLSKPISNVYLVDNVNKTGSLVELGFLSNEDERKKLIDTNYQDFLAYIIYISILEYLTK